MPINTQFFVLFHGNRTQAQAFSLQEERVSTNFAKVFLTSEMTIQVTTYTDGTTSKAKVMK